MLRDLLVRCRYSDSTYYAGEYIVSPLEICLIRHSPSIYLECFLYPVDAIWILRRHKPQFSHGRCSVTHSQPSGDSLSGVASPLVYVAVGLYNILGSQRARDREAQSHQNEVGPHSRCCRCMLWYASGRHAEEREIKATVKYPMYFPRHRVYVSGNLSLNQQIP